VVASATIGTDAFDARNRGQMSVEELYIGLRTGEAKTGQIDLSYGAQEWKAGTGLLLANGGASGFSRCALKLGPRRAWRIAGLARAKAQGATITGLYLDPTARGRSPMYGWAWISRWNATIGSTCAPGLGACKLATPSRTSLAPQHCLYLPDLFRRQSHHQAARALRPPLL